MQGRHLWQRANIDHRSFADKKEFRGQKIATLLMKRIIKTVKDMNISKISMLAPCITEFPLSWYKKIGFRETGWIELEANTCSSDMQFCEKGIN
jgi:GNAT superfamily N-acetyltransferase